MGLFNIIRLANDYNKAKKLVEDKKADVEKITKTIKSLQKYSSFLKDLILDLEEEVYQAEEMIGKLANKLSKKGDK